MFQWARKLLGLGGPSQRTAPTSSRVQARYDNALWTDENQRNWWMADYLSPKSANNYQVRRQLRIRSRYEVSNNPYLFGVCTSNADDLVGTGPTLQCLLRRESDNLLIQSLWGQWADEVGFVEKVRTVKLAVNVDGEGPLVLKTARKLEHPVKLYPLDIECDQITGLTPTSVQDLWLDGLILDPITGRVISYDVLKTHPGDYFFPNLNPLQYDRVAAKYVVFWYKKWRPGQVRGVPVFTPALDLFSELRSFRRATLRKANIAAQITGVYETEAPADDTGLDTPDPWENMPIDAGTMMTVPSGAKAHLFQTGDPSTTYKEFQVQCLGEACRPLRYPLVSALGSAQDFNFSSARLDFTDYRNSLDVERADCARIVLDHVFRAWVEEAYLAGILPRSIRSAADVPHEWHWPGYQPLDPVADATADHARLSNGTLTWKEFWAKRGYDWQQVMTQQAKEKKQIEMMGLIFGDPLKKSDTVTEEAPAPKKKELARA